jgi:hypothetical protein
VGPHLTAGVRRASVVIGSIGSIGSGSFTPTACGVTTGIGLTKAGPAAYLWTHGTGHPKGPRPVKEPPGSPSGSRIGQSPLRKLGGFFVPTHPQPDHVTRTAPRAPR